MYYIKRFNEELSDSVYRSAIKKLKNTSDLSNIVLNNNDRAMSMTKHADDVVFKKNYKCWTKLIEQYSKYGLFKFLFYGDHKEYYISIMPDNSLAFIGTDKIIFVFDVLLIPKDLENLKKESIHNGSVDEADVQIILKYEIIGGTVGKLNFMIDSYNYLLSDRKSLNSLKRLLSNIFESTFDYDFSSTGIMSDQNVYDSIEREVIQDRELSIDYGLDMGKIREDLIKLKTSDIVFNYCGSIRYLKQV